MCFGQHPSVMRTYVDCCRAAVQTAATAAAEAIAACVGYVACDGQHQQTYVSPSLRPGFRSLTEAGPPSVTLSQIVELKLNFQCCWLRSRAVAACMCP